MTMGRVLRRHVRDLTICRHAALATDADAVLQVTSPQHLLRAENLLASVQVAFEVDFFLAGASREDF